MLKKIAPIQVKAGILLFIFSLNMMKGIACSLESVIGLSDHDHCSESTPDGSHLANDSKTTIHLNNKFHKQKSHSDTDKKGLQFKSEDSDNDCCTDSVVKFNCLDKSVTQNINASLDGLFFVALISNFLFIDIFKDSAIASYIYIPPPFHPPAPDIRVFIRSFQI